MELNNANDASDRLYEALSELRVLDVVLEETKGEIDRLTLNGMLRMIDAVTAKVEGVQRYLCAGAVKVAA